jgi:hypothetical protein
MDDQPEPPARGESDPSVVEGASVDVPAWSIRTVPEPGAWAIASDGGGTLIRAGAIGRRIASTDVSHLPPRKPDETIVAYHACCAEETAENRANARLIAAAPDLLGALAACVGAAGEAGGPVGPPILVQARAALAKAHPVMASEAPDARPRSSVGSRA